MQVLTCAHAKLYSVHQRSFWCAPVISRAQLKLSGEHGKVPGEHQKLSGEHVEVSGAHQKDSGEHVKVSCAHVKIHDFFFSLRCHFCGSVK